MVHAQLPGAPGRPVTLRPGDKEATSRQVELVVALAADAAADDCRRSGAGANVTLVDARRDDVIAVPVAALIHHDGSPAVRVAEAGGTDRVVAVETGLVGGGR